LPAVTRHATLAPATLLWLIFGLYLHWGSHVTFLCWFLPSCGGYSPRHTSPQLWWLRHNSVGVLWLHTK
jgi:hypothetical protein